MRTHQPTNPATLATELRNQLRHHNHLYYTEQNPEISDSEYDTLRDQLTQLEQKHPELHNPNSPTHQIGAPPSQQFTEITHNTPMLSLNKITTQRELQQWHTKTKKQLNHNTPTLVCEPKIDGVAISITYTNGKLTQAATRGDGTTGENVTPNIQATPTIPQQLQTNNPPEHLEIRGEIYLPKHKLKQLNKQRTQTNKPPYVNTRNAASGSLRQKDPTITATRGLKLWVYQLTATDQTTPKTHTEQLKWLQTLGLPTNPNTKTGTTPNQIWEHLTHLAATRHTLPYQTDGAVIKINNTTHQNQLGHTTRTPRWAIAFKYPPEERTTQLLNIEISVGRTGRITPHATLKPVFVGGTTITQATLHNKTEIARKDLRIGDHVTIRRAGDVIPEIVAPITTTRTGTEKPWTQPTHCPFCQSKIHCPPNEKIDRCAGGRQCPSQLQQWLHYFGSKHGLNIEGLGHKTIKQLIKHNLITGPADIFNLQPNDLTQLKGWRTTSANKLITAINKAKNCDPATLLTALGIRHIGKAAAELITQKHGTLPNLTQLTPQNLQNINGIGPTTAQSLTNWLTNPENQQLLHQLHTAKVGTNTPQTKHTTKTLQNTRIAITGTLPNLTRAEVTELIKNAGGHVTNTITQQTTLLLAGHRGGTKQTKAKKLGIPIINPEHLNTLLQHGPHTLLQTTKQHPH